MENKKIELNQFEVEVVVKGLGKLVDEAGRISEAAIKVNIPKAAKEAEAFKDTITGLQERIMGLKKLPFGKKNEANPKKA